MATRREFLQAGIAASALSLTSSAHIVSAASDSDPVAGQRPGRRPLYGVIFDHRYQESVAFGAEAEALGYQIHGIGGDITDLWYKHLSVRWKTGPAAIAGLTDEPALFCLERLAWDYQMRVVYQAAHDRRPGGAVTASRNWPRELARTFANHTSDADALRIGGGPPFVMGSTAVSDGDPEPLVSWIIAPRARAQQNLV